MSENQNNTSGNIISDFTQGVKKAININLYIQIPNFILSFTLIRILQISGILDFLGRVLDPIMAFFTLPGEASAVLASAWLSSAGGIGATVAMIQDGTLNASHSAILLPMIMAIGSQLQMLGRVLNVTQPPKKYYKIVFIIGFINTIVAGLIMSYLIKVL